MVPKAYIYCGYTGMQNFGGYLLKMHIFLVPWILCPDAPLKQIFQISGVGLNMAQTVFSSDSDLRPSFYIGCGYTILGCGYTKQSCGYTEEVVDILSSSWKTKLWIYS